jgi:phospholipase C
MKMLKRRQVIQAGLSAAALASVDKALALPARSDAGSIMDVEHVVILMQENRAFDHYFGSLKGVRGFDDPRAISLPGGKPVWFQPTTPGAETFVLPFHFDSRKTSAETMNSLDHSWKGSHQAWKRHDNWIKAKTPLTMGYFTREDIPFYYALADAFTVCDAYHCSIFASTNPNRMFLFSGTNGLVAGLDNSLAVSNPITEPNETADAAHDGPKFPGFNWTTYAERLEQAGVSWKVYQEYDNYGDNGLAYFKAFRGAGAATPMGRKGRDWAAGSTPENAKASRGEHLVAAFEKDVAGGTLPQVSWIVAPYITCEHPAASPSYGEQFTAGLIEALTRHPETWAKTVFILNYDENDGFFDHMPVPVPATAGAEGKCDVDMAGEVYRDTPVGLGPRVPMLIVSPWTKGGYVNSELFDHTSVIRFLEARFGVREPNITPWRRAVCGDLTSAFDFRTPNAERPKLPETKRYIEKVDLTAKLPKPAVPVLQESARRDLPRQEPGQRPARPLPYDLHVTGALADDGFHLVFANQGRVGAAFQVYAADTTSGPWFYTVPAGASLSDVLALPNAPYDVEVYGPNGLYRRYKGEGVQVSAPTSALMAAADRLTLQVLNPGPAAATVGLASAYGGRAETRTLPPRGRTEVSFPLKPSAHWYDVAITWAQNPAYLHRFAGHVETGQPSLSDPLIGRGGEGLADGLLKRFRL